MALRWYVVHAYSNFEHRVAEALKDRIKLQSLQDKYAERGFTVTSGIESVAPDTAQCKVLSTDKWVWDMTMYPLEIKVEIVRSGDIPLPVGELAIGGTVPAIANAFLALTGKPLRATPFTPERVKKALA